LQAHAPIRAAPPTYRQAPARPVREPLAHAEHLASALVDTEDAESVAALAQAAGFAEQESSGQGKGAPAAQDPSPTDAGGTTNAAVKPEQEKAKKESGSSAPLTWGCTAAVIVLVWGGVLYVWSMGSGHTEEAKPKPRKSLLGRATVPRATIAMLGHLPFDEEGEEPEAGAHHGVMTVNEATTNMITTMIGAGVLAFPSITASLGWVVAPIFIVAAGGLNTWICMILAGVLQRANKKQHVETLRDVGSVCFGPRGGAVLEWTLTAFLFCVACVLIVLIADNMNFLVKWEVKWWTGVSGALLSVIAFLQDVSLLSKLAGLGVLATLMYVIGIAGASASAIGTFPSDYRKHDTWPTGDNASVMSLCNAFAILLFGFHCVSLIPSFFHDMKEPEKLPTAIMRANGFAVGLYLIVGLVGYYGFGIAVEGNVVNSMCAAPGCAGTRMPPSFASDGPKVSEADSGEKMAWGYLIGSSVVVNLAVTLPLICYVLFQSVERAVPAFQESRMKSYLMRIVTLVTLTGLGMSIPYFMAMLGLVSSVMVVLIGLAMPPVLALKLDAIEGHKMDYRYVVLVMLSVFLMTLGLNDAIEGLLAKIAENS